MKVAYIIGPIRSKWGLIGRLINIWRGRQVAVKLWKAGFAVICPHLNSFTIAMAIPDEDKIVECDLEITNRCDFVVLMDNCQHSTGAEVELEHCRKIKMKTYCGADQAIKYEKTPSLTWQDKVGHQLR